MPGSANAELVAAKEQLKSQLSLQAAKVKQSELKIGQLERQLEIRVRPRPPPRD